MSQLEDIEYTPIKNEGSSLCNGCSVLKLNKSFYCYKDYLYLKESDVLFVSDSFKKDFEGNRCALQPDLLKFVKENIDFKEFQLTAAVKCPDIKDMTATDSKICRSHLSLSIDKVKPKLIIALGNLALKMLVKKSGMNDKRGQSFKYISNTGFESIVVPTFHPYNVSLEPRNLPLFRQDIKIAYEKIVSKIETKVEETHYKLIKSIAELANYMWLTETHKPIAVDVETTGLDFKTDKIQTIAFSWDKGYAICLPVNHKEGFMTSEIEKTVVINFIREVLKNKNNIKVMHKASFDVKMMLNPEILNFIPPNIRDTQILAHQIDEISPKGLMDLVKKYYPEALMVL